MTEYICIDCKNKVNCRQCHKQLCKPFNENACIIGDKVFRERKEIEERLTCGECRERNSYVYNGGYEED